MTQIRERFPDIDLRIVLDTDSIPHAMDAIGAFAGKLDSSASGTEETFVCRLVRAPEGGFRDCDVIRN